jgi:hypothetical protein
MIHFEISSKFAQEQHRDRIAAAEQHRLAAACRPRLAVSRRAARPIGRALMHLGATLLRYGRVEAPAEIQPYHASARSIQLN